MRRVQDGLQSDGFLRARRGHGFVLRLPQIPHGHLAGLSSGLFDLDVFGAQVRRKSRILLENVGTRAH